MCIAMHGGKDRKKKPNRQVIRRFFSKKNEKGTEKGAVKDEKVASQGVTSVG